MVRAMQSHARTQSDKLPDAGLSYIKFDYNSVPQPVAKFLRMQADHIRRQCTKSIIQIGKAFIEAKHHLSHGAFLRWVEWEVCMPVRTAQAYMRVASWAADKGATVAHLPPSALYVLSAASTPKEFVVDVLRRAENGEHIGPSVMRRELEALRVKHMPGQYRTEACMRLPPRDSARRGSVAADNETSRGVTELAAILLRSLPKAEFARVRDIIASDAMLSDPHLALNLERAFGHALQDYVAVA